MTESAPLKPGGESRWGSIAEADFDPLPSDVEYARAFGRVAASLRRSGRKVQARGYDAMIAATALANGLPLYTGQSVRLRGNRGT